MDAWIDNASFEHAAKLFAAGIIAGAFGLVLYSYVVAKGESAVGIQATGAI